MTQTDDNAPPEPDKIAAGLMADTEFMEPRTAQLVRDAVQRWRTMDPRLLDELSKRL